MITGVWSRYTSKNPALQTANIEFFHQNPNGKVLAYVRWNDQGSRVVAVANFSNQYLAGYQVPHFSYQRNVPRVDKKLRC